MNRAQKAEARARVVALLEAGSSRQEAAEKTGFSPGYIYLIAKDAGLTASRTYTRSAPYRSGPIDSAYVKQAKANEMAALFRDGSTLEEIGQLYGCTREWVRQMIKTVGVVGKDGGLAERARRKKAISKKRKDTVAKSKYGCTWDQYMDLVRRKITIRFQYQRRSAASREIPWTITLWEWWQVWERSGKWHLRGRNSGQYVMSRKGDKGAYDVGNVEIITCNQNARDARSNEKAKKDA